jgi:hypothetical protein
MLETPSLPSLGRSPRVSHFTIVMPFTALTLASCIRPLGEVEDLKDSLGGGETVDNEAGVTTRGVENDAYAQEKKVDNLDL